MKNINDIDVCTLTDEEIENLTDEELNYLVDKLEEKHMSNTDDEYTLTCWYNMDEESRLIQLIEFEKEARGIVDPPAVTKAERDAFLNSLRSRAQKIITELHQTARNV